MRKVEKGNGKKNTVGQFMKSIYLAILLTEASWLFPGSMADAISESYEMQHALSQHFIRQKPTSNPMAKLMIE